MNGRPVYERILTESELLEQLPTELAGLIKSASETQQLHALAISALDSQFTESVFQLYEPLIVELGARWLQPDAGADPIDVLAAFARILPIAAYLLPFASQHASSQTGGLSALAGSKELTLRQLDTERIRKILLALFRLMSFDLETFAKVVSPIQLQSLFPHEDRVIRYLAIRCFALYMHAADAATEKMLRINTGVDPVEGPWEGITIDYRLLGLWEERRWETLEHRRRPKAESSPEDEETALVDRMRHALTIRSANICGVLVPRIKDVVAGESSVVNTPTTVANIRRIARALLDVKPILLVGLPNSGKTTLINDVASNMGQAETMITLHLNEQTDAKSLLGMYATSSATGSFSWQAGVLTKAAREGRWVLIEDLDRAPSEVLGLILPIIERGELTIASRRERIKCAEGFKIIATMKSSYNTSGEEIAPNNSMLGSRLWQKVHIQSLSVDEMRDVILRKFPLLESRVPTIMEVYKGVCFAFHGSLAIKGSQGRTPGFRDLIKLCNRLHRRLQLIGAKTGFEAAPESIEDEILLDIVDVFLKYLPEKSMQRSLAGVVAEALQISPQRAQFCLEERAPAYNDKSNSLVLGREVLQKIKVPSGAAQRLAAAASRFASTRSALSIMEQVAASVQMAEPVLLVGETGIGKTTVIQQLATLMRQKLTVVNLSQQSESTDLLGGFKPVSIRTMAVPMLDEFTQLFELTFSAKKNQKFLASVSKSVASGNWVRLVTLWHEAVRLASGVFNPARNVNADNDEHQPAKKRKLDSPKYQQLRQRWQTFESQLSDFEAQVSQGDAKFAFAFVQGKIVRALRNGEWVLLDEVNLASPDTLENIASLLNHGSEGVPSVLLSEAGDVERVFGHPEFRIFGAMNPATDAGKRDLPPGLRSRFTEFYVHSPDTELDDLLALIEKYLGTLTIGDHRAGPDLAQLYLETKKLSNSNKLTDGAGQRPHFSIRTLVRALIYVIDHAHVYGLRRAIYEGFSMSFLTVLSLESENTVVPLLEKYIFETAKNAKSLLGRTPRPPEDGQDYVQFKHYWMRRGPLRPEEQPHYIITPFIEKNLKNLVRASSTRRFPVLLQGPTSAGKTSMIEYLAKVSGNKFVRINNHEHTDLQEYLGSYISSDDGSLRYQEGVLVEALRNGYWIVLDELNLAPSDVLEALNRLLDDNRELFIPETQEVVHPHPNFMLFATQNPAGLYGGRKVLSRAFRNRFLELHFDDIPESELEFILKERSQIAPSFCSRIVSVYRKLSLLRQSNRLFEQKNSFATLRDLFRWALRDADDREQLAVNGYMLLAERVRNPQEKAAVKSVIEEVMKVKLDDDLLYSESQLKQSVPETAELPSGIVWTKAMRRLFVLVSRAIKNNEPILLVGETGCGKTQLCQAVAEAFKRELYIVNAHVNLETGDLIGAQRPIRNRAAIEKQLLEDLRCLSSGQQAAYLSLEQLKQEFSSLDSQQKQELDQNLMHRIERNLVRCNALFEWSDGSLITAMKTGQFFLLDEISLADDSVLERLNSVLEPHRSILLAEKGPIDSMVVADAGFQFMSTMNPGGDYGKRELSAALRNRMTEIWAPQLSEDEDILPILQMRLTLRDERIARSMLQFAKWFKSTFQNTSTTSLSLRDLLAWVDFVNACENQDVRFAVVQGAAMVFVDTLGANPAAMLAISMTDLNDNRQKCLVKLGELFGVDASNIYWQDSTVSLEPGHLKVGPFLLPIVGDADPDPQFTMDAPTTISNSVRIARGLQSSKPILMEGSPGVGKTTLVTALARALGKPLTRINLSEQTDLTDLFGSDVPVEGGDVGQFTWRDAPFLRAMQRGDWVLLDEMNLASQSVLEGLNSCLDHRQQVYIAELDQTFKRHPDFVLFAAQNPHHQGGGRKGLPASFVNRFTVVYADSFTDADLKTICGRLFPGSPSTQTEKLVDFISILNTAIATECKFGTVGGPWEVNLRDIQRWLQLADRGHLQISTRHFLDVVISQRFRSAEDRAQVSTIYDQVFDTSEVEGKSYFHNLTPEYMQVGLGIMSRDLLVQRSSGPNMKVLPNDLQILESLILCIDNSWPSILVGPTGCGKTTLIKKLAAINGASLEELALSADTDTMDLIGGFEQIDHRREIQTLANDVQTFLQAQVINSFSSGGVSESVALALQVCQHFELAELPLDEILSSLFSLCQSFPDSNLESFYKRAQDLTHAMQNSDKMKVGFEWTEGALTRAVQTGSWVILDNANLCNPSVLDRLNSLTEPNGTLILNEQRTQDGSARVIVPHPKFRLFLTMDPRHGELSRAMRNRCTEICFLPSQQLELPTRLTPSYTCESLLYRLRYAWQSLEAFSPGSTPMGEDDMMEISFDHLSPNDIEYLSRSPGAIMPVTTAGGLKNSVSTHLQRHVLLIQENEDWKPHVALNQQVSMSGISLAVKGQLQPVHPLVNEPLLSVIGGSRSRAKAIVLAYLQQFKLELYRLKQRLVQSHESASQLKPSQMTRLERSLASDRVHSLMKDSTQPVGSFLSDCGQALFECFSALGEESLESTDLVSALRMVLSLCYDIYRVTNLTSLDEGEFQVYLQIGRSVCASLLDSSPALRPLERALSNALSRFQAGWALSTGLSMQRMWDSWRHVTPSSQDQLTSLIDLEATVRHFTDLALQTRVEVSQLSAIWNSLMTAHKIILQNGADGAMLLDGIKQTVTALDKAVRRSNAAQYPYFANEFEAICQYHDLEIIHSEKPLNSVVPLLAGRHARSLDASIARSRVPNMLNRLTLFSGAADHGALAIGGVLSLSLLDRLTSVNSATLGQMDLLQAEKKALSEALTLSTACIATDQARVLARMLAGLTLELVSCHSDLFDPASIDQLITLLQQLESGNFDHPRTLSPVVPDSALPPDHYFVSIAQNALPALISSLISAATSEETVQTTGRATVQLAVVLLRLFVPDKAFDPSLDLVVQRQRHKRRLDEITAKSNAILAFERRFSGQSSTLRSVLLGEESQELGSAPPPSSVTRPEQSELSLLHGEFTNLINSVVERSPEMMVASPETIAESRGMIKLLRDNIVQLCSRLSTNYRSYDDMTVPIVRFLRLLDLGLFVVSSQHTEAGDMEDIQYLSKCTPLMGGCHHPVLSSSSIAPPPKSQAHAVEMRLHEMTALWTVKDADPSIIDVKHFRESLRRIFSDFHHLWKTQLREDQEKEAEKNELYRYRGSWEDEEEINDTELRELFPTYDDGQTEVESQGRIDPRAIAVRLSSLHAKIVNAQCSGDALPQFVKESGQLLGSIWSTKRNSFTPVSPQSHLPAVLLLLEDAMQTGSEVQAKKNYNFYTDCNLAEARKLVDLTLSVQSRFAQIQTAWPEHAVLQEVINCCSEILQFKHTEPVAKFLTKLEKLHSYVHEWQLVASREYSAAALYDEITATTVGWRRLELTTWAKLLDLEKERCDENVSSWWFVAYEALLAVPLQIAENGEEDMTAHIQGVISTLEQFFQSTSLGQFSRRLQLVSDFQALLVAFTRDYDCLTPLVNALANFISHFRPFEPSVDKLLHDKRAILEKDIKEQIQLASWKDTNIVALKESARRSHVKLFKLVRKYREALAQPIQAVLEQGSQDLSGAAGESIPTQPALAHVALADVVSVCQSRSELWSSRAPRFQNPDGTARNMMNLYSSVPTEFDIATDLEEFTTSIIENVDEFKSATPKTLTEDNKDDVQHLKVQKRRLFADTLKRLFEMGVKRNAGTSLIEAQVSLSQILSTSAAFDLDNALAGQGLVRSADSYFHRLLDLLPRARLASRNYSEELSNVEVSRSMGSVEYLLFIIRRQRGVLSPALSELGEMRSTLDRARHLWTVDSSKLVKDGDCGDDEIQGLTRLISWLSPILALALRVVEVHSRFSGASVASLSQEIKSRRTALDDLCLALKSQPALPVGIASSDQKELVSRARNLLAQLEHDVKTWISERPDLSFALEQIYPWVKNEHIPTAGVNGGGSLSVARFDEALMAAVDKMLVGLQQLASVPTGITFDGLMSRSDEFFSRASRALHLKEITTSLAGVLDRLQNLQDASSDALPLAAALVASILPIATKFYEICQDLVIRFSSVHREICKTSYILTKTFTQVASEGFCSPAEASQDEGKEGKMESGTGLGEGEGAEDISKDIGDDEDLAELAQQAQKEDAEKDEMEDSAEAVNMDQEELEGETGDHKEEEGKDEDKDEDGEDQEDDIDEEVGSVDGLDSGAVDEKLWDGANDEQQKETENEEGKGQAEDDQQTAAQEQKKDGEEGPKGEEGEGEDDEEEEDEEAPDDEGEAIGREDMDVTDPNAKEEENLELPDEMQLDGDDMGEGEEGEDDDGMDDLSDMGPLPEEDQKEDQQADAGGDDDMETNLDEQAEGADEENGEGEEGEETNEGEGQEEENEAGGEEADEPEQEEFLTQRDENEAAGDDVAPSDAVNGGLAADQDQNENKGASGDAQQESGSSDPTANAEQQTGAAKESEESKRSRDAGGAEDSAPNEPQMQAFKKLGDILEQWHRRQKEVLNPSQDEEDSQPLPQNTDMADADFEHLKDDDDVADTQALGQANEDQAQGLDQNKGVESDNQPGDRDALPDVTDEQQETLENQLQDSMQVDREAEPTNGETAGAFIPGDRPSGNLADGAPGTEDVNEELDEVDSQLAAIHLSSSLPPLTPESEARRLWSHYENATNDLSLSLTEQLRLILAPTMATKLRGDFRTGKRLNIKRIIPYIASQYKRDKIWMRRSIPSKRNYQIMLAVDDSKSMLESGSGQLAFETLALVAKSLSMLEVGDLCVLGFGNEDHVRVAHEFGKPFSSEAGSQVFQHFSYQQTGTNVRKLIADSIALFREARWKRSPGSGSADLWQLQLIISDGICEDHDTIRRLVRQALEERIMIVFIIVDAVKGSSILDLSQASFEADPLSGGEMKLRMKRYLENFPFPYYLVVRDVRELPSVLATALKQWFAEVVDVSS